MTNGAQPGPRRLAAVRRMARPIKSGLLRLGCAATERWISSGRNYEILVLFGMRRSGNHLAINWILGQVPGSAVFYNNIRQNAHPFDVGMREFRTRWPNRQPKIILSYEDLTPSEIEKGPLPDFLSDRIRRHNIGVKCGVILRDPYNLFASRLKKWPERFATEEDLERQRALYTNHAGFVLDPKPVFGDAPVVPILYNHLVADTAYRHELAGKLNINPGDAGLDEVPVYGHGSSFDGYETEGTSVRAGVFDRWKNSLADPTFQKLAADKTIQKLGKAIFDMDPPD